MRFLPAVIVLLLLLMTPSRTRTQTDSLYSDRDTAFWCAFLENLPDLAGPRSLSFLVSAEEKTSCLVLSKLFSPQPDTLLRVDLDAGESRELFLPTTNLILEGSGISGANALKVLSSRPVRVQAVHSQLFSSESTSLLPEKQLGNSYLPVCYEDEAGALPSQLLILATENSQVEITPADSTLDGRPPATPFTIQLGKGRCYQLQSPGDLTGTRIRSTNGAPLAVFSGARQANVDTCGTFNSANHLWEQSRPVEEFRSWGRNYYFVPFFDQGGDVVKIVAANDGTRVFPSCDAPDTLLNAGEWIILKMDQPSLISATDLISVSQYNSTQGCSPIGLGDPFMIRLPPATLRANQVRSRTPRLRTAAGGPSPQGERHYLQIIMDATDTTDIRLNGQPIASAFDTFPLFTGLAYARIAMDTGQFELVSDSSHFQAYSYGYTHFDGYGHHLGNAFFSAYCLGAGPCSLSDLVCVDSAFTLFSCSDIRLESLLWDFGDGRTDTTLHPTLTYSSPGNYVVSFIARTPGGCTFNSYPFAITVMDCTPLPCDPQAGRILARAETVCRDSVWNVLSSPPPAVDSFFIAVSGQDTIFREETERYFPDTGRIELHYFGFDREANCYFSDSTAIQVLDCPDPTDPLQFPNVFTPDGDGINDRFGPVGGSNVQEYHLRVFNRWGEQIFESFQPQQGWDGRVNGKVAPSDVYIWIAAFQVETGGQSTKKVLKGDLTLLR